MRQALHRARLSFADLYHSFDGPQKAMIAVLSVVALAVVFLLSVIFAPFPAVVVYEQRVLPDRACVGGEVRLVVDQEIRKDLRRLEVEYRWVDVDEGHAPIVRTETLYDLGARSRAEEISRIVRRVPSEAGEYYLRNDYTAVGARWGVPIRQDFTSVSTNTLRVIDDEDCEEPPSNS